MLQLCVHSDIGKCQLKNYLSNAHDIYLKLIYTVYSLCIVCIHFYLVFFSYAACAS